MNLFPDTLLIASGALICIISYPFLQTAQYWPA
jgi:hypothetical protein